MKELPKLFLRSQTVLGLIPFLVLVISDPVIVGFQQSTGDREAFYCVPRLNASTEQGCFDDYSSWQFFKFYHMLMLDGFICFAWVFAIVKSTMVLRRIKINRQIQNNESQESVNPRLNWPPAKFRKKYVCLLCLFLSYVGVVTILFCCLNLIDSGFSVPSMYKCSLVTDTTSIPSNQTKTDFYCHDEHYKERSNLSIATVVIKFFILILCMINFIYVVKTPADKLVGKLLGDVVEESGSNLQEMPSSSGDDVGLRSLSFSTLYRDPEEDGSEMYGWSVHT